MIDIAAVGYFPDVLARFRLERPDVELRLTVAPSSSLLHQLQSGQLDAAVLVGPGPGGPHGGETLPDHPDVAIRSLVAEELAVYAPPDPEGRWRRSVPPPTQWGPWVTFPSSSTTRAQIAAALRALGAEFQVAAESHQPDVLRQLVQLGMGWTVLPVLQGEAEPTPLVRVRQSPLLTRHLVVAHRRAVTLDPATRHLLDRLHDAAEGFATT
jgi:DNA-binding transcriptional LysR family regulator